MKFNIRETVEIDSDDIIEVEKLAFGEEKTSIDD